MFPNKHMMTAESGSTHTNFTNERYIGTFWYNCLLFLGILGGLAYAHYNPNGSIAISAGIMISMYMVCLGVIAFAPFKVTQYILEWATHENEYFLKKRALAQECFIGAVLVLGFALTVIY